jgi:U3 small nucleolar RNA-associated protein 13
MDKDYLKAAKLAFRLKQPGRLLSVVNNILTSSQARDAVNSQADNALAVAHSTLARLVAGFSDAEKSFAFECMRDWNTTARHCHCAQALLHAVLANRSPKVCSGHMQLRNGMHTISKIVFIADV